MTGYKFGGICRKEGKYIMKKLQLFILFVVIGGMFGVITSFYMDIVNYKKQIKDLTYVNTELNNMVIGLKDEVELRQDITSLIVDSARAYNIDPRLYARLLKSESSFRPNPKHAVPYVVGMAAINIRAHKGLRSNPKSFVGNIYAGAEVLAGYLDSSDSLTMAITKYKGISTKGYYQANQVVKDYKNAND